MINRNRLTRALVQNYGFKETSLAKLPTIDYVYPDFTADGNTESFRFSEELRRELAAGATKVKQRLSDKSIVWTNNSETLIEVHPIAPRLGLEDQITRKINSIYSYDPILFIGADNDFVAYVVKPVINADMAWFELTASETEGVKKMIEKMAAEKPYRTLFQKILGGLR